MQQLELVLDGLEPPRQGSDLEMFRHLAVKAEYLPEGGDANALRKVCMESGLTKAGWRFLARHGHAAWAAAESVLDEPAEHFDQVLIYLQLQVEAGLQKPATPELGLRYLAAFGNHLAFDCVDCPPLLRLGERHLQVLPKEKHADFICDEFVRVLDWFRDEQPAFDKNQLKAGWRNIHRQYQAWRKLNGEKLSWGSLLQCFTIAKSEVRPLASSYDLCLEGHEMHHCSAVFAERCRRGDYRVFSVIRSGYRPARSTVGLEKKERGWEVDQVKGPCNAAPDQESLRVAAVIANRYEMAEREHIRRQELQQKLAKRQVEERRQQRSKMALQMHREAHHEALSVHTVLPSEVRTQFSERECDVLTRRAFWMRQLERGDLQPVSMAQVHFIAAARGISEPNSEHEHLWLRYRSIREQLEVKENRIDMSLEA